jgi:hypothetical protein
MARNPDDYDEAYEERRPRPRRRRRDDYEEDEYDRPRRSDRAGLDGMFLDTNMVMLVLFAVCCQLVALILSIIELSIGRHPEAKQRAIIVLVISGVLTVLGTIYNVVRISQGAPMWW